MAEKSVDLATATTAADVPTPFTSNDSDIWHMLETVMTVQVAYGQNLVDMLDEFRALRADLEHLRRLPPPLPFDDGLWLLFDIPSQKGGVHL